MYTLQHKVAIKWSPNFAYAIGLITSDGHLAKDGRHLGFASKDKELVEKFKYCFSLTNRIRRGTRGGEKEKKYFTIVFGDKVFYRFLNGIGLENAKSKTIKEVKVPDTFFSDFVRGVFDGDGTFYSYWDTRWPKSFVYQISFASASLNFVQWLKNRLTVLYDVRGFICRGDGVYNIRYVKSDTRKLFSAMYYRDDGMYLERKHQKIKRAFELDKRLGIARGKMPG